MNGSRYISVMTVKNNLVSFITPGPKKSKVPINERSHAHNGTIDVIKIQITRE